MDIHPVTRSGSGDLKTGSPAARDDAKSSGKRPGATLPRPTATSDGTPQPLGARSVQVAGRQAASADHEPGPSACVSLLPTSQQLAERYRPKQDITFGSIVIKQHSTRYKAVLNALDAFHQATTAAQRKDRLECLKSAIEACLARKKPSHAKVLEPLLQVVADQILAHEDTSTHRGYAYLLRNRGMHPALVDHAFSQGMPLQQAVEFQASCGTTGLDSPTIQALADAGLRIPFERVRRPKAEAPDRDLKSQPPVLQRIETGTLMTPLGAGSVGSVYLLEEPGPSWSVFKPEIHNGEIGGAAEGSHIDRNAPNFANRSVCTFKVDRLLGLSLVPETRLVAVETKAGLQVGSLMGLADGRAPSTRHAPALELDGPLADAVTRQPEALRRYADTHGFTRATLAGNMLTLEHGGAPAAADRGDAPPAEGRAAKTAPGPGSNCLTRMPVDDPLFRMQLTRLQWLDHLTNQRDRGLENFFVALKSDGHFDHLTAIDNDASFGRSTSKSQSSRLPMTYPGVIDKATYDALQKLDEAGLRGALAGHLSEAEIDAAVARLQAIQKHLDSPAVLVVANRDEAWRLPSVETALGLTQARTKFAAATAPRKDGRHPSQALLDLNRLQGQDAMQGYVVRLALEQERQAWVVGMRRAEGSSPSEPSPYANEPAFHDPQAFRALFLPPGRDAKQAATPG